MVVINFFLLLNWGTILKFDLYVMKVKKMQKNCKKKECKNKIMTKVKKLV